jgi:hypothetical protein
MLDGIRRFPQSRLARRRKTDASGRSRFDLPDFAVKFSYSFKFWRL